MPDAAPVTLSVLLPVHAGTPADQFRDALESVLAQTRPPDQLVVVVDGPVTAEHERHLSAVEHRSPCPVAVIRLDCSRGLGHALSQGLQGVTGDWVARADADDLSLPHRFEVQCRLAETGLHDVVGSPMLEFADHPDHPRGVRLAPESHRDVLARMRTSNPMNHPTVLFRTALVRRVGGYHDVRGAEDYDLWARLAAHGARFVNVSTPLVAFRADDAMFDRRKSWAAVRGELRLQRNLVEYGTIGHPRACLNVLLRIGFRLMPKRLMVPIYRRLFVSRAPS